MIIRVRMQEGAGLEVCRHKGHWYYGERRVTGKGENFRYRPLGSFDEALDIAVSHVRAWRGRGWKLRSQAVYTGGTA